jgi:hypothetical protein
MSGALLSSLPLPPWPDFRLRVCVDPVEYVTWFAIALSPHINLFIVCPVLESLAQHLGALIAGAYSDVTSIRSPGCGLCYDGHLGFLVFMLMKILVFRILTQCTMVGRHHPRR